MNVLAPGVYRLRDAFCVSEVRSFDVTRPDFIGKDMDMDTSIERPGAELELSFVHLPIHGLFKYRLEVVLNIGFGFR